MYRITEHPILPIPAEDSVEFTFEGQKITGQKGFTIAAALHQAGKGVHKHSLEHRAHYGVRYWQMRRLRNVG